MHAYVTVVVSSEYISLHIYIYSGYTPPTICHMNAVSCPYAADVFVHRVWVCVPRSLACLCVPRKVEEVPVDGGSAGGYSVGTLDKPTTRLSQYTRGKTGSMNPFTPGGEVDALFHFSQRDHLQPKLLSLRGKFVGSSLRCTKNNLLLNRMVQRYTRYSISGILNFGKLEKYFATKMTYSMYARATAVHTQQYTEIFP